MPQRVIPQHASRLTTIEIYLNLPPEGVVREIREKW
jgi:hypothetical protein